MNCLLASDDLMFAAQAAQAAREAGYSVCTLYDLQSLLDAPLDGVTLVLVDLNLPQFDPQIAADRLQTHDHVGPDLLAIGPHVHRDRLEAARRAGWRVHTRGQFHATPQRILGSRDALPDA